MFFSGLHFSVKEGNLGFLLFFMGKFKQEITHVLAYFKEIAPFIVCLLCSLIFLLCIIIFRWLTLKAHRQISKKRFFEKYCSCDKVCQFSALQGKPWRSYLENATIDNKFINKFLYIKHLSKTFWEEKLLGRDNNYVCKILDYF